MSPTGRAEATPRGPRQNVPAILLGVLCLAAAVLFGLPTIAGVDVLHGPGAAIIVLLTGLVLTAVGAIGLLRRRTRT